MLKSLSLMDEHTCTIDFHIHKLAIYVAVEEEKVALEVPETPQEAAHEDVVKGENHIIPEGQTNDFHQKIASSGDSSVTKDSNAERHESYEKG